ncbi:MAG: hypothetical protein AAF153_03000 [Pseudomonadota bacterium]
MFSIYTPLIATAGNVNIARIDPDSLSRVISDLDEPLDDSEINSTEPEIAELIPDKAPTIRPIVEQLETQTEASKLENADATTGNDQNSNIISTNVDSSNKPKNFNFSIINEIVENNVVGGSMTPILRKSLMFNDSEIDILTNLINDYSLPVEEPINEDEVVVDEIIEITKEVIAEKISFFIKSIIYFSPANWSLRINDIALSNNQLTTTSNFGSMRVLSISSSQATLRWQPSSIDALSPNWKRALILDFASQSYFSPDRRIEYNQRLNFIKFTIGTNQSFDVEKMKIVEGRLSY